MIRVRWVIVRRDRRGFLQDPRFFRTTIEPELPQVGDTVTLRGIAREVCARAMHEDMQPRVRVGRPRPLPEWQVFLALRGTP